MQPRCPPARLCGLLLAFAVSGVASAAQIDYLIEMGIEHNTNVNLGEHDAVSEDILEPTFGFNASQQGSTVQATASGALQYRDFLGGEFSDEFRGQLSGHLNWTMVPERLNLTVEDNLAVEPVDPLAENAPDNQQQTNVFAIGPTLNFRLGDTMRGEAELRYINSYADKTKQFNTSRASGAASAIKDLDATSTISANVADERVAFTEDGVSPDYSRYSVFGRYTRTWTEKLDFIGDLGYSWLKYSGNQFSDQDNPLARLTVNWHPTQRSTFSVRGLYQFSDSAADMLSGVGLAGAAGTPVPIPTGIVTGDATTTADAYLERRLTVGYKWSGTRITFDTSPYYYKIDYPNGGNLIATGLDESGKGATLGLSYLLQPLVTIGVTATGENLHYTAISREDDTWTFTAYLRQQWTRNWSWRVQLSRYDRSSDAPGQSADQNIIYFGLTYTR